MLELNDVHTHYGLSHVLQGVSLRVGAGEVVGLFGRNGVGKTTVMKTIAGWVAPTQGTVQFDGQPIGGVASERICRGGIGFVHEDRRIFPGLTVEENLVLGFMQIPGRSRAEDRRQLDATYTRFPRLGERRQQMGTTLSGGEQQMLAMARVLVGAPRLLLIDEPTEGLAPKIVELVGQFLQEIRKRGVSILLIEQKLAIALDISERLYLMGHGRIVFEGTPADLKNNAAIRKEWLEV